MCVLENVFVSEWRLNKYCTSTKHYTILFINPFKLFEIIFLWTETIDSVQSNESSDVLGHHYSLCPHTV